MQPRGVIATDLVLLGAGHAHVEVLRRLAIRPEPGLRLTLIGREPATPYTGMLPGLLRGDYTADQAQIDLAPLASAAGARLIVAEARALDLETNTVAVDGRPPVRFDLLSIDVGGAPPVAEGGIPVKPIGRFLQHLGALEDRLPEAARIVVVGGGAGGSELALALARRTGGRRLGGRVRIVLVSESPEPLPGAPFRARAVVRAALVTAGVELVSGVAAGAHREGRLALSDGSFLAADAVLWATGVRGPAFLAVAGLVCDADGCVRVARTLQSISHPGVFAAGDCTAVEGAKRPKAGVWAVRAGAPLAANLRRAARGDALRRWRPQREALAILGLGDGRAVAWRNGVAVDGRLIWRWKDWLDRRWMGRFDRDRLLPAVATEPPSLGAAALASAFAALPRMRGPDGLVGPEAADGAVMLPPPGMAVLQSATFFRSFLNDPYVFGAIAAAHALSGLHARGARPWTALAVATVPASGGRGSAADLTAMLQGASEVLVADGCALVGGDCAEAAETALGFAVTGLADPERLMRKAGLRPDDALVLTKPLGTGIVLAGHGRALARAGWLLAAVASMRTTNGAAARVLRAHGVTACTTVGELGLAGNLLEMLDASGVAATVRPAAMPALPGVLELAAACVESPLAADNRRFAPGATGVAAELLVDPQISGGLLAGVSPPRLEACLAALREAGIEPAVIGTVERADGPDGPALQLDHR